MEKKEIPVRRNTSKAIDTWARVSVLLGVIAIFGGIILIGIGASSYDEEMITAGIVILSCSIGFFFWAAVLRGYRTIIQSSENKIALFEQEYKAVDYTD